MYLLWYADIVFAYLRTGIYHLLGTTRYMLLNVLDLIFVYLI